MAASVRGKVCAVFGGSSGIGKAICQLLAEHGAKVVVIGRNSIKVSQTAKCLYSEEQQHSSFVCNITDPVVVHKTVSQIESELGSIKILINAAGINKDSLLVRSKTTDIETIIQTNLVGSMYTSKAVLKSMIQQREGTIVNIGSVVGLKGNVGQSVYSASKSGIYVFLLLYQS